MSNPNFLEAACPRLTASLMEATLNGLALAKAPRTPCLICGTQPSPQEIACGTEVRGNYLWVICLSCVERMEPEEVTRLTRLLHEVCVSAGRVFMELWNAAEARTVALREGCKGRDRLIANQARELDLEREAKKAKICLIAAQGENAVTTALFIAKQKRWIKRLTWACGILAALLAASLIV